MVRDVAKLDDPMKGAFSAVRGVEGEPSGPILKPFWDSWIPWGSMVGMSFFSFQFCWGAFWGSTAAPGATWRSAAEGASSGRNVRPFSVFHHVPSLSLRVLFFRVFKIHRFTFWFGHLFLWFQALGFSSSLKSSEAQKSHVESQHVHKIHQIPSDARSIGRRCRMKTARNFE